MSEWPATAKQRAFGMQLERQLDVGASNWREMSVSEASDRINHLVTLREFRKVVANIS